MQTEPYAREQAGLCGASSLAEQRPTQLTRQAQPDGWTRQRPRKAMLEWQQDYRCGVARSWV